MDKIQGEVEKTLLNHEKEAFKQLKSSYTNALADIKARVKILQSNIDDLQGIDTTGYTEEQLKIYKSQIQSKVYQLEYQKTLSKQVGSIVDVLKQDTISNVQGYLDKVYTDGYLGMQYYINKQGIPVTTPINPSEVVKVVNKKIEDMTFADRINVNMNDFKKTIRAEISRGIANGSSYKEIASMLSMVTGEDMYKSQRIVRTEGARVSSEAKLTSIRDMKEKGADLVKVWDSTLDLKTRREHGLLDGQWVEVDESFKVSGYKVMGPGLFGDPAQDCNCRCVLLSVPRWDVDSSITKYDNEHDELVEVKNYQDWKQGYYLRIPEIKEVENVVEKAEQQIAIYKLTDTQKAAITSYNSFEAYILNKALREGIELNPFMKSLSRNLSSALNKMPTYKGTVNRSLFFDNNKAKKEFIDSLNEETIVFKGFTSASKGIYDENDDVRLIIKSKNGKDISLFNSREGDGEVLFDKNSKFKLVKSYVKDGKPYFELKEI